MKVEQIDLSRTNSFSSSFLDYISDKEELRSFYGQRPEIQNFASQIDQKVFSKERRQVLVQALVEQYENVDTHQSVSRNIDLLYEGNTFTITTGHQLNIFTGPLYFIYKIVTVINTCKKLKAEYPDKNFVPIYWMASEDHDFEEINHFNLFGKKYSWNCEEKGAVGRFSTENLEAILNDLPEKSEVFEKAYKDNASLSEAVRCYINDLFGAYGVVALDADNNQLKGEFNQVMEDDLMNHHANNLVEKTSSKLSEAGYSAQVFPRAINFFYLNAGIRERIVKEGANWNVLNTDLAFNESQLKELLAENPESFSPNVVLRPLYQEVILPNLAYVGGPAEVVYWLQLKDVFEHYSMPFPILMPRNFALVINKASQKKVNKFGFSIESIFNDAKALKEDYLKRNGEDEIDLKTEKENLISIFNEVANKAIHVDGSLKGFIGAELNKAQKSLENIEKRLTKAGEQKHEVALNQISALKEKLFPNGGLQERHDNFLNFYFNNEDFIQQLVDSFDPFDYSFYILKEE